MENRAQAALDHFYKCSDADQTAYWLDCHAGTILHALRELAKVTEKTK